MKACTKKEIMCHILTIRTVPCKFDICPISNCDYKLTNDAFAHSVSMSAFAFSVTQNAGLITVMPLEQHGSQSVPALAQTCYTSADDCCACRRIGSSVVFYAFL